MPNCVPPLIADENPENYLKAAFFSTLFYYNCPAINYHETIFLVFKN